MADGYARVTGRAGVVLVTSGPGATNAVTGIATAHMDSAPMVVITGQVPRHAIGSDAFQEVDCVGHHPPVRQAQLPGEGRGLPRAHPPRGVLRGRERPAGAGGGGHPEGRDRGPRVVRVPGRGVHALLQPGDARTPGYQIRQAADLILSARRPMIYTGGGVVLGDASEPLVDLTRFLGYPITNTLMGLGAFPGTDPAVRRHARDARHLRGQHGDARVRRAHRDRGALRRPGGGRPEAVLPRMPGSSTSTSIRPPSRRPSRSTSPSWGRCEGSSRTSRRAAREQPASRRGGPRGVVEADRRVARERLPALRARQRPHQAPVRHREAATRSPGGRRS